MAYTRDKDRTTRGVGAIASLDHALPERQRMRRRVLEDTQRRDRAMAAVTRGALGAVRDPLVRAAQRAVFARTGATHVPVPTGARPHATAPAPRPTSGVIVHDHRTGGGGNTPAGGPPTGGPWAGLTNLTKKLAVMVPKPAEPAPTTPTTTPTVPSTPPTSSGGGGSGGGSGGGGGGGGGSSGGGAATSGPAVEPLPPLPDAPAEEASADHTTRNLLIAGGAAIAAYLLFIRGRQ